MIVWLRFCILAVCAAGAWIADAAAQSFLDSDFYCRTYGCVVVHDGNTFDVYDNYNFSTGGTVPVGGRMIAWAGNPFQGVGTVNPVFSGTRTEGFHTIPLEDEGAVFGIDSDSNGIIDLSPGVNQRGFLDASGVFESFSVSGGASLTALEQTNERSFFLSSRTDFYLAAQASVLGQASDFNSTVRFEDIGFAYGVTRSGNDDGMSFGSRARNGNYIRPLGNVDDLSDIAGPDTYIMEFRNAIRQRSAPNLPDQSVRFDYAYGFQDYDLSMGAGYLRYQIEFTFYNR
ncbi:MAG: hypothetical protein AAFO57_10150 [Pseudomonadota bacterium]